MMMMRTMRRKTKLPGGVEEQTGRSWPRNVVAMMMRMKARMSLPRGREEEQLIRRKEAKPRTVMRRTVMWGKERRERREEGRKERRRKKKRRPRVRRVMAKGKGRARAKMMTRTRRRKRKRVTGRSEEVIVPS